MCTPTEMLTSCGPVIPMFFDLSKFLILLTFIYSAFAVVYEIYIYRGNCNSDPKLCRISLVSLIDIDNREDNWIIISIIPSVMVVSIVAFVCLHYRQSNLREAIDAAVVSPADYSALIFEVKEEQQSVAYIEQHLTNLLFSSDLPPVQIAKVNFGKFEGNLRRIETDIQHVKLTLEALQLAASSPSISDAIKDKLCKKVNAQMDRLKYLEDKLERYRNILDKEKSLSDNSVAFVSFKTQAQADCVFLLETRRMKMWHFFSKFLPCFCKNRGHYIKQAPEPDDIKWKFIGYTEGQRTCSILVSYVVTLILVGGAFAIQLWLRIVTTRKTNDPQGSSSWSIYLLQWLSAFLVTIVNTLIVRLAYSLSSYEKHLSYSMFMLSHTRKLIFTQFINSAGVPVALIFLP
jgi:hypothetical protein